SMYASVTAGETYGVSGPIHYGLWGALMILFIYPFGKRIRAVAPRAHTLAEVMYARHGRSSHLIDRKSVVQGKREDGGEGGQRGGGIRDRNVTGVQTCALPIFDVRLGDRGLHLRRLRPHPLRALGRADDPVHLPLRQADPRRRAPRPHPRRGDVRPPRALLAAD